MGIESINRPVRRLSLRLITEARKHRRAPGREESPTSTAPTLKQAQEEPVGTGRLAYQYGDEALRDVSSELSSVFGGDEPEETDEFEDMEEPEGTIGEIGNPELLARQTSIGRDLKRRQRKTASFAVQNRIPAVGSALALYRMQKQAGPIGNLLRMVSRAALRRTPRVWGRFAMRGLPAAQRQELLRSIRARMTEGATFDEAVAQATRQAAVLRRTPAAAPYILSRPGLAQGTAYDIAARAGHVPSRIMPQLDEQTARILSRLEYPAGTPIRDAMLRGYIRTGDALQSAFSRAGAAVGPRVTAAGRAIQDIARRQQKWWGPRLVAAGRRTQRGGADLLRRAHEWAKADLNAAATAGRAAARSGARRTGGRMTRAQRTAAGAASSRVFQAGGTKAEANRAGLNAAKALGYRGPSRTPRAPGGTPPGQVATTPTVMDPRSWTAALTPGRMVAHGAMSLPTLLGMASGDINPVVGLASLALPIPFYGKGYGAGMAATGFTQMGGAALGSLMNRGRDLEEGAAQAAAMPPAYPAQMPAININVGQPQLPYPRSFQPGYLGP